MLNKLKELYLKIKERVYNKSGAIGSIVGVLAIFGYYIEADSISGLFENFDTFLDSIDNIMILFAGIYEAFRKEKQ